MPISEVHPELFHYTSVPGLFGILESQCLWATHWQHLNDENELMHFRDALAGLIRPTLEQRANEVASTNTDTKSWLAENGGVEAVCEEQSSAIASMMYDTLHNANPDESLFEFYITSFCTPDGDYAEVRNHGLLSQWRYYGDNGGYALVFDTAGLEKLMEQEHSVWPCRLSCGDVSYSSDSEELMKRRLDALPSLRNALSGWFSNPGLPAAIEPVLEPFLNCCIHYKHWAFAEEREVRLVAMLNGKHAHRMHEAAGSKVVERTRHSFTRDGKSVPCIHLFEGLDVGGDLRLPIRRIIVGPGPTQTDRETKLKAFLKEKGYAIDVTCSSIPIRF